MLKSANLGLNIFEGPDNVRRINFVENFELLDKTYGELAKNNSDYVLTTGNANTYLATLDRTLTSYYEGLCLKIKIHVDSTGNCTLNVNNLGAKYIKDSYGNIVKNLKKDIPYHVCYNGSDFILLGKGGGGNATSDKILSGYTATVDDGPITGTMANQGAKIYTPGRSNIAIPEGYHNGQGYIKGDPNFIPENILAGKTMFGITGIGVNVNYYDAGIVIMYQNDNMRHDGDQHDVNSNVSITVPMINIKYMLIFNDFSGYNAGSVDNNLERVAFIDYSPISSTTILTSRSSGHSSSGSSYEYNSYWYGNILFTKNSTSTTVTFNTTGYYVSKSYTAVKQLKCRFLFFGA